MDSNELRRQWAERSGEYSPEYYAYYGPDETSEAVRSILERFLDRDARILELGFSSGRHLAHLYEHGFEKLAGIEVNDDALDVMEENYPDLAAHGTFYLDAIEDVVGDLEDGRFDAVYSVETLQHLHPDCEWVFAELFRITDELLVTVENEGDIDRPESEEPVLNHVTDDLLLYHRDWGRVFTDLGFVEVEVQVEAKPGTRDSVRAFQVPQDRSVR